MSAQSVKERARNNRVTYAPIYKSDGGVFAPSSSITWSGRQYTVSSGHKRGRDGRFHEGGAFFTYQDSVSIPTRHVSIKGSGIQKKKYSGPIHSNGILTSFGDAKVPSTDSSYLDPYGATAISIIDPTNPNAQTGVALGEIVKDRYLPIPVIGSWRRRTEAAKAAGGEYLNAVFGWMPLVRDMKNTAQSVLDGNTILDNYRAASGSLVHREFAFDDEVKTESTDIEVVHAAYANGVSTSEFHTAGTVPATRVIEKTTKRWFSGSFTYHANADGLGVKRMFGIGTEAEKLFGISLTPDLVWELTPWSWAIDWVSNAGDVISNINSFALAGLVMQYGYIMEETTTIETITPATTGLTGVTGTTPPVSRTRCTKRRRPANPFGFGVQWEGLTPTQLAITAALGLTHLR